MKLITLAIILFSFSLVNAQNPETVKTMYQAYMDSVLFIPVALIIFVPVIVGGLFGIAVEGRGHISRFIIEFFVGLLVFLLFPYFLTVFGVDLLMLVVQ